jgi:hypothetical protein
MSEDDGTLRIRERTPNPEVIEQLERLLAEAKRGELYGVVYVTMGPEYGWGMSGTCTPQDLALAVRMADRLVTEHIDDLLARAGE